MKAAKYFIILSLTLLSNCKTLTNYYLNPNYNLDDFSIACVKFKNYQPDKYGLVMELSGKLALKGFRVLSCSEVEKFDEATKSKVLFCQLEYMEFEPLKGQRKDQRRAEVTLICYNSAGDKIYENRGIWYGEEIGSNMRNALDVAFEGIREKVNRF